MRTIVIILTLTASLSCAGQGWTVSTLKSYYDALLEERDKKMEQKFTSLELAVTKANDATEKRFESVNEFRLTLTDQQRTFVPRSEYEAGHKVLEDKLTAIATDIEKIKNTKQGGSTTVAYLAAGISLFVAIIALSRNFIASITQKSKG